MFAELSDIALAAPIAFVVGLALGYFIGSRWEVIKPRRRDPDDPNTPDGL